MQNGKALVVDDEKLVCELIEKILTMNGFHVKTTTDSVEALKEIKQGKDFDVIISDFMMPNVTGVDLLRAANKQAIDYQFILISGFHDELMLNNLKLVENFSFINKPFCIEKFSKAVNMAVKRKREITKLIREKLITC